MNLSDELARLAELHRRGDINSEEFARAKATLLDPSAARGEPSERASADLAEVALQGELNRLEIRWQAERGRYLVWGRSGPPRPIEESDVAKRFLIGLIGAAIFVVTGSQLEAPGGLFLLALGGLFFAAGLVGSVRCHRRWLEYEAAEEAYQRRRAEAIEGHRERPGEYP
jgi:hypothetical protein